MTENKKPDVQENVDKELPAFIKAAPELLPIWDWWVKEGKSTLVMLGIVAVAVLGFFGVRNHMKSRDANASNKLTSASTAEDLAAAVSECKSLVGTSKVAGPLKIRLAKEHFDAGHYQEALDVYESYINDEGSDAPFSSIAVMGKAYSLEGLKKFEESAKVFSDYAANESKANDGFRLMAKLGAIRCKAQQGDVSGAEADLEALKEATEDERDKMLVSSTLSVVKHYDFSRVDADPLETFTLPEANALPLPEAAPAAKPAAPAAKPAAPAAKPAAPAAKPAAPAVKPAAPAAKPAAPAAKPAAPAAKPAVPAAKPAAPAVKPAVK